jgi:hypothetical protein
LFEIYWTYEARTSYEKLRNDLTHLKQYKAVRKCILLLAQDPRHPGLQTHEYESLIGPAGEKVFEAYAEQPTPAAYCVFWYYGPSRGLITVIAITQHP